MIMKTTRCSRRWVSARREAIDSDKVDILTGPVHSGILMGMRDKVHNSKTILDRPNAGADAISRERSK
jgi:hypothetical protein